MTGVGEGGFVRVCVHVGGNTGHMLVSIVVIVIGMCFIVIGKSLGKGTR